MVRTVSALVLGGLLVATTAGAASADSKTGEVKFTAPKKESAKIALGAKLKLDADLQMIEVGALTAVNVQGKVRNTANARMHYSYNVAFLDKDKNLIGCQNFVGIVEPGKELPVGTFIQLPADQIAKIAHYSVAFYEGDKPIGSK